MVGRGLSVLVVVMVLAACGGEAEPSPSDALRANGGEAEPSPSDALRANVYALQDLREARGEAGLPRESRLHYEAAVFAQRLDTMSCDGLWWSYEETVAFGADLDLRRAFALAPTAPDHARRWMALIRETRRIAHDAVYDRCGP